jgi:hypothetical protein
MRFQCEINANINADSRYSEDAEKYDLDPNPSKYACLQHSAAHADGINDEEDYCLLRDALESLGFSESEQDDLFKVIAGLLQFSNVAFKDAEVNGGEGSILNWCKILTSYKFNVTSYRTSRRENFICWTNSLCGGSMQIIAIFIQIMLEHFLKCAIISSVLRQRKKTIIQTNQPK